MCHTIEQLGVLFKSRSKSYKGRMLLGPNIGSRWQTLELSGRKFPTIGSRCRDGQDLRVWAYLVIVAPSSQSHNQREWYGEGSCPLSCLAELWLLCHLVVRRVNRYFPGRWAEAHSLTGSVDIPTSRCESERYWQATWQERHVIMHPQRFGEFVDAQERFTKADQSDRWGLLDRIREYIIRRI